MSHTERTGHNRDGRAVPCQDARVLPLLLACVRSFTVGSGGNEGIVGDSGTESPEGIPGDSGDDADPVDVDPTDEIFDPSVILDLDLTMARAEWADLRDNPYAETWHTADFTWGSEIVESVGLRAFGAGSLIPGKPSIKISFDHFVPGQAWRGLEQIKLDNSSQDAGFMNELIGTAILRRSGVPAARTGWARVRVNEEPVGFFVLFEPIDDVFLRRWFNDDGGNLYGTADGHHAQGLNPIANGGPLDWYVPQTKAESDGSDLLTVMDVVANGSDDAFLAAVDVDEFTRMSVTRSIFGGIDTFSADGNNFYLYNLDGYWSIIAWDLDADLGYPYYFSPALTVDPAAPWLTSPWATNPVSGAPYTDPVLTRAVAMGTDIPALVAEIIAGPGEWSVLDAEVTAAATLIRDDVYNDVLGYGYAFDQRRHDLRLFLHTRLSGLLGRDAADCAVAEPGVHRLADLAPTGTVGWGELLIDKTYWAPGFNVAGGHYCTGIFAHAPSDVAITIPAGATTLSGAVGLQDWVQQCGDGASFAIVQGGVTLWSSPVLANYDPAVTTDAVPISPGALRLVTLPNGEYSCDTAAWLDVRVW